MPQIIKPFVDNAVCISSGRKSFSDNSSLNQPVTLEKPQELISPCFQNGDSSNRQSSNNADIILPLITENDLDALLLSPDPVEPISPTKQSVSLSSDEGDAPQGSFRIPKLNLISTPATEERKTGHDSAINMKQISSFIANNYESPNIKDIKNALRRREIDDIDTRI